MAAACGVDGLRSIGGRGGRGKVAMKGERQIIQ